MLMSAAALSLASYLSSTLTLGCGYSVAVRGYIDSSVGVAVKAQYVLKGTQGETARRIVILPDDSWYLTYEFLRDATSDDIACIVATGPVERTSDASGFRLETLPAADIGMPVHRRPVLTK